MLSIALPPPTENLSTEPPPAPVTSLESKETDQSQTAAQTSNSDAAASKESSLATGADQKPPEPPKRLLTDEDIAALRTVVQPQQQQQVQQKELSQDEIDKLLHVWKPDAKWYERLSEGGDAALKAVSEMQQGLMAQASRRTQLEIMQLKSELSPQLQGVAANAAQAEEEKFYGTNKDLEPHRDLVGLMYNNLKAAGKLEGMTQAKMYKAVADETRAYAKSKGMNLALTTASAVPNKTTNRKVPAQLNSVSQGGGGGGSSADTPAMAALRRIG